jgi:hypothetical protein
MVHNDNYIDETKIKHLLNKTNKIIELKNTYKKDKRAFPGIWWLEGKSDRIG